MKKRICVLLIICIMVSICGCGSSKKNKSDMLISEEIDDKNAETIIETDTTLKENNQLENSTYEELNNIKLDSGVSAAITKDGKLYMWGLNYGGALGIGKSSDEQEYINKPVEILENVKAFDMKSGLCGAITNDDSLYIWGYGVYTYNTENGKYESITKPYKVLDNVKSIEIGNEFGAAITCEDMLYIFGKTVMNTSSGITELMKIDNVKEISLGFGKNAAVTNDGDLYIWNDNFQSMKILSDVKQCSIQSDYICILKNDNTFLISDDIEEMDNGADYEISEPKEMVFYDESNGLYINEKVSKIYVSEYVVGNIAGVITENNTLYVSDLKTQTDNNIIARKIMENVKDIKMTEETIGILDSKETLYLLDRDMIDAKMPPVKFMEDVKDYIIEPNYLLSRPLVLKNDGGLYGCVDGWSETSNDSSDIKEPERILENVRNIASGGEYYGAITEDNNLYMFGKNDCGQIGNGQQSDYENIDKPVKININ